MKFFFLKMTNTVTSQNIDFPSESPHVCDILYFKYYEIISWGGNIKMDPKMKLIFTFPYSFSLRCSFSQFTEKLILQVTLIFSVAITDSFTEMAFSYTPTILFCYCEAVKFFFIFTILPKLWYLSKYFTIVKNQTEDSVFFFQLWKWFHTALSIQILRNLTVLWKTQWKYPLVTWKKIWIFYTLTLSSLW